MLLAIIGSILNVGFIALYGLSGELPESLILGLMAIGALGLVGAAMAGAGKEKAGAYLIIASSILFIPLGLVAAFGARQILNEANKKMFDDKYNDNSDTFA